MTKPVEAQRDRLRSLALLVAVATAGLASRRYPSLLPVVIRKRTGDALWASAAFAGVSLLRPSWSTARVAAIALAVAFTDELSQTYHASWIDRIRSHALGHLFLGAAFHWLDLVAHTVGVAAVFPVDLVWVRRPQPRRPAGAGDERPQSACVR